MTTWPVKKIVLVSQMNPLYKKTKAIEAQENNGLDKRILFEMGFNPCMPRRWKEIKGSIPQGTTTSSLFPKCWKKYRILVRRPTSGYW